MKHVDRIGQSGGVDDAPGTAVVPYADLFDALAYRGHGFEIVRLQPVLHAVQLLAGIPFRVIRELPDPFQGVAEELDRLERHEYIRVDINSK